LSTRLLVLLSVLVIWLAGCASNQTQTAPVVDRLPAKSSSAKSKASSDKDWRPDTYIVKKGDTLYSISLEYGYDYKDIAQWNSIQPPYVIHVGRQLRMKDPKATAASVASASTTPQKDGAEVVATPLKTEPVAAAKPLDEPPLITEPKATKEPYSDQAMKAAVPTPVVTKPASKPADKVAAATTPDTPKPEATKQENPAKIEAAPEKTAATASNDDTIDWTWPTSGKIMTSFSGASSAKGIDIGGTQGQPILAAGPGKVIYVGSSVRGYGKLVIIKHNKTFLSAYAHNSQILVKEGQEVTKGQKIAEMGSSDTDRVKLHFEIRKLGEPVDPAKYLPASAGN
jgi:lipoprotein NlpD